MLTVFLNGCMNNNNYGHKKCCLRHGDEYVRKLKAKLKFNKYLLNNQCWLEKWMFFSIVNFCSIVNVICPSRRDIIRGTQSSAPRWVRGQEGGPGCAGGHAPPRPCLRVWAPPQGPARTPAVPRGAAQSRQQPPRPAAAAGRHRGQWRHQGRGHRRLLGRRGAVHIRAASGGAHVLETRQQDVPRIPGDCDDPLQFPTVTPQTLARLWLWLAGTPATGREEEVFDMLPQSHTKRCCAPKKSILITIDTFGKISIITDSVWFLFRRIDELPRYASMAATESLHASVNNYWFHIYNLCAYFYFHISWLMWIFNKTLILLLFSWSLTN